WAPATMRVPQSNEVRYLVYTTAAYGAEGISYYIYTCPNHLGGIADADGTPASLYYAVRDYNREFTALLRELEPLHSLGVWHTALQEPGCAPLATHAPFRIESVSRGSGRGFLLGYFGAADKPTHVLVVNLDYQSPADVRLIGPGPLQKFSIAKAKWSHSVGSTVGLRLPPGGGHLVRLRARRRIP